MSEVAKSLASRDLSLVGDSIASRSPSYGDGIKIERQRWPCVQGQGQISQVGTVLSRARFTSTDQARVCGKWYVRFAVACDGPALAPLDDAIGIDLGLEYLRGSHDGPPVAEPAMLSTGGKLNFDGPSGKWQVEKTGRAAVARQWPCFRKFMPESGISGTSFNIVFLVSGWIKNFGTIVVEDLHVKGLAGGLLASVRFRMLLGLTPAVCKIAYKARKRWSAL